MHDNILIDASKWWYRTDTVSSKKECNIWIDQDPKVSGWQILCPWNCTFCGPKTWFKTKSIRINMELAKPCVNDSNLIPLNTIVLATALTRHGSNSNLINVSPICECSLGSLIQFHKLIIPFIRIEFVIRQSIITMQIDLLLVLERWHFSLTFFLNTTNTCYSCIKKVKPPNTGHFWP